MAFHNIYSSEKCTGGCPTCGGLINEAFSCHQAAWLRSLRRLDNLRCIARRRFSLFQGVASRHEDSSEKVAQAGRDCAVSAWDELRMPRNLGGLRYVRRRFSLFQGVVCDMNVSFEKPCASQRTQFIFNQLANNMARRDVDFLNARRLVARNDERQINKRRHFAAARPEQADCLDLHRARLFDGLDHVRRNAAGRDGEGYVALATEGLNLAGEDEVERAVIADRREQRRVGGQGQGRERLAFAPHFESQFGGDVLRVGGRAPVAEDQQLTARAHRLDDHSRGPGHVPARLLEEAALRVEALRGHRANILFKIISTASGSERGVLKRRFPLATARGTDYFSRSGHIGLLSL